jgi:hypothetical protein
VITDAGMIPAPRMRAAAASLQRPGRGRGGGRRHAPGKAALPGGVAETVLAQLKVDSADPDRPRSCAPSPATTGSWRWPTRTYLPDGELVELARPEHGHDLAGRRARSGDNGQAARWPCARLWAEVAGYVEEHVCHRWSHLNYAA